ncbi:hypothetical protein ES319_A09G211600v1 [Gossypium barbadense]|uniref:Uncharacterized protein n=1 Tax=Gossypium barbadense TaxID=3634 RepID=A0A5J5UHM0_GOSBA|nr:hypothetical protein ES319_A09G211600v1 [Gossypium barbadense]
MSGGKLVFGLFNATREANAALDYTRKRKLSDKSNHHQLSKLGGSKSVVVVDKRGDDNAGMHLHFWDH